MLYGASSQEYNIYVKAVKIIGRGQQNPRTCNTYVCWFCCHVKTIILKMSFFILQVAEKALKAALLTINANDSARNSHYLTKIASSIRNENLHRLARDLEKIFDTKGHLATRYPDMLRGAEIPAEFYKMDEAIQGKELCMEILTVVESLL